MRHTTPTPSRKYGDRVGYIYLLVDATRTKCRIGHVVAPDLAAWRENVTGAAHGAFVVQATFAGPQSLADRLTAENRHLNVGPGEWMRYEVGRGVDAAFTHAAMAHGIQSRGAGR